jgi:hypothetical protein
MEIEYISAGTLNELEKKINTYLSMGYRLHGTLIYTPDLYSKYVQTVIKPPKELKRVSLDYPVLNKGQ